MAGEWREVLLGNVAAELTVGHVGPMASEYVDSGIPFLRSQNVEPLRINDTDLKFITEEFHGRLRKSALSPGDVVIVRTGKPGACAVIPHTLPVANCSDLVVVRCGPELDPRFLAYYVNSVAAHHVNSHLVGAVQQHFNVGSARALAMRLPDLPEQRAIAHILGTLDEKIELNRRMNETLEAMARALFKSWFVDFDPVRAKAEGRDPGVPKPLADLFPARLVDSETGEIPEGWEVAPIADHFEAVKGISYKGVDLGDDGMPLHNLNSVYEGGGYKYEGIKYYTGEYADRHIVMPGDMIVANTEQGHDRLLIGYAAIVPTLFGPRGIASHHIYRLRPKPRSWLTSAFLCRLLNSPQMHELVSGYANGTTVNMLPIDGVQKPLIVCPPGRLVAAFTAFGVTVERRREEIISESRTLASLRDALLPKLISGEIRVKVDANTVEAR